MLLSKFKKFIFSNLACLFLLIACSKTATEPEKALEIPTVVPTTSKTDTPKIVEESFQTTTYTSENSNQNYRNFTNALAKVQKLIEEQDYRSINAVLPKLEDDNLMLFITDPKTGICHAWLYFYAKQLIENQRNKYIESLDNGNQALNFLEVSKVPIGLDGNPPNQEATNQFLQMKEECKFLSYIEIAKSSMHFGKNIAAENYLKYVIAPENQAPNNILCEAVSGLAELYTRQGRYNLAYQAITQVLARVKFLPKSILMQKANAAFLINKSKEAFSDLLSVMHDEDLSRKEPWNDPIITLFLLRLAHADEADITGFYEALFYQVTLVYLDSTLKNDQKGESLIFYINERKLLCDLFPFLKPQDDLNVLRNNYANKNK